MVVGWVLGSVNVDSTWPNALLAGGLPDQPARAIRLPPFLPLNRLGPRACARLPRQPLSSSLSSHLQSSFHAAPHFKTHACDPGLVQRIRVLVEGGLVGHADADPRDDEEEEAEDDPTISSFSSVTSSVAVCWSPSGQQSRHHRSYRLGSGRPGPGSSS